MQVTISIPAPLRQFAGGQAQIVVDAKTAGEALDQLTSTHSALRRHLYNDQNTLRNFVNVYLNDEDIRHASGPDTPVKEGDSIAIVPRLPGAVIESESSETLPELSGKEIMRYSRRDRPRLACRTATSESCSVLMIGTGGSAGGYVSGRCGSRSNWNCRF